MLFRFKTSRLSQFGAVSSASTTRIRSRRPVAASTGFEEILAELPVYVKTRTAQMYVKSLVTILQQKVEVAEKNVEVAEKKVEVAEKNVEVAEKKVENAELREANIKLQLQSVTVKMLASTDTLNARGVFEFTEKGLLTEKRGTRRDKWEAYFKSNPKELDVLRECDGEVTDAAVAGRKFAGLYKDLSKRVHEPFEVSETSDALKVPKALLSPAQMCLYEFLLKKAGMDYVLVHYHLD